MFPDFLNLTELDLHHYRIKNLMIDLLKTPLPMEQWEINLRDELIKEGPKNTFALAILMTLNTRWKAQSEGRDIEVV